MRSRRVALGDRWQAAIAASLMCAVVSVACSGSGAAPKYRQHRAPSGAGLKRAAAHATADHAAARACVNPADTSLGNRDRHDSAGADCHRRRELHDRSRNRDQRRGCGRTRGRQVRHLTDPSELAPETVAAHRMTDCQTAVARPAQSSLK
jgi:hypothetical protein